MSLNLMDKQALSQLINKCYFEMNVHENCYDTILPTDFQNTKIELN